MVYNAEVLNKYDHPLTFMVTILYNGLSLVFPDEINFEVELSEYFIIPIVLVFCQKVL